ncbi:hypothetical protein HYY69_07290 [Candidatus Woesearchaeota archaeon]|nr:hypothetical protein [Candidatus Woesearchaeota archaeon]
MSDKEKSIDFCLDEIKEQYGIFLEGFDDIKKKSEILLVVCSLIIPYFEDIFLSINKYKSIDVKTAVIKSYKRDLERNLSQIEKKRESVRNAETFIKIGIILVVGNLLFVIMI